MRAVNLVKQAYVFDAYQITPTAIAYSFRRVNRNYNSFCVQIRRVSDSVLKILDL
jgi:hypothetical protein